MGQLWSSVSTSVDNGIKSLVFQPPERLESDIRNLDDGKTTHLITLGDNKISTCVISPDNKKCLIFAHGNGSDIMSMHNYWIYLSRLHQCTVIGYDPPGYGLTPGAPSEIGCHNALESVVEYATGVYENIILVGQSLGTGSVIHVANKLEWKSPIVLISPYKSIVRVAVDSSMIESSLVAVGNVTEFDSYSRIGKLQCPVRIIHGAKDTVVPIQHGKDLAKLVKYSLGHIWLPDAGHNDILQSMPDIALHVFPS